MARPDSDYAGDVPATEAWAALSADPAARLVDVRTHAEWTFVGLPDLAGIGKSTVLMEWQSYPDMAVDPAFARRLASLLSAEGAGPDDPIFFICRSGGRSREAARALTAEGFHRCFNVAEGFEGVTDSQGHRGRASGWKADGLPWRQS